MNYMDFDPYLIRERNQQTLGEMRAIRCEERLREKGGDAHRGSPPWPRRLCGRCSAGQGSRGSPPPEGCGRRWRRTMKGKQSL
jgi:hypothetical protein